MHKTYEPGKAPDDYNFEEYCPYCDSMIPVVIDEAEERRYATTCPVCGEQLMLCTLCQWDQMDENHNAPGDCDFHDATCSRRCDA